METTSFASGYRLGFRFPLPPAGTVKNFLTFSSSFNTKHLLSASVRGSRSSRGKGKTTTSSSSSSSTSTMRIICGKVREINEGEFSDVVLKSSRPVLVEFVATWCGPCRLIAPAVETLAQAVQEYEEKLTVVKIDHDSNPRLIEEYKVYGLPTLILFKNGKEVRDSRREGAITKVKLQEYIDGLLESLSIA